MPKKSSMKGLILVGGAAAIYYFFLRPSSGSLSSAVDAHSADLQAQADIPVNPAADPTIVAAMQSRGATDDDYINAAIASEPNQSVHPRMIAAVAKLSQQQKDYLTNVIQYLSSGVKSRLDSAAWSWYASWASAPVNGFHT